MRIADIEGIGSVYASKLAKLGIRSTDALLKKGRHVQGAQGTRRRVRASGTS